MELTGTVPDAIAGDDDPGGDLGPVTYNRAMTSIVQCGSHLRRAQDELRLAVQILTRLDDAAAPWPRQTGRRAALLQPLEDFLQSLAASESQLREAARGTEQADRLRSA